jgi:hypothetical protein
MVIATATALVSTVGVSAPAHAASPPTVNWANSVDGDLGRLRVSATAESGIASIKAHIISYATQQEVAVSDRFNLASGTEQDGVWVTVDRFQLPELGFYRVDVEVTDRDGQHVLRQDAGALSYYVATFFDETLVRPATMTYYEREVTLSGRLLGRWPGDGQVRSLVGFPVWLSAYPGDFTEVTTGEDGRFSGPLHLDDAGSVYAYYPYDNNHIGYLSSNSEDLPVGIDPAATYATLKVSKARVNAGTSVTLSGQFMWRSKDGWTPLANAQFGVLFCVSEWYCPTSEYPTTDAEGRYRVEVTPWQTGYYQVSMRPDDPFLATAFAKADVVVLQPAEFSEFTAVRTAEGNVAVNGTMSFGNFSPGTTPVQIQYSPTGNGGWTTMTTVQADGGYNFSATVEQGESGYWRAYYAGQTDFFQSAVSAKVHVA